MDMYDFRSFVERREPVSQLSPLAPDERKALLAEMGRPHGHFMSVKLGYPLPWWWRRERDLMCLLETDAEVASYGALQDRLTVRMDDEWAVVHPRFKVLRLGVWTAVDVLSSRTAVSPGRAWLTATLTDAYAARGWRYETQGASEIRRQPRFGNALLVLEARRFRPTAEDVHAVMDAFATGRIRTVADLVEARPERRDIRRTVYALVLRGRLGLDLDTSGADRMPVFMRAGGDR